MSPEADGVTPDRCLVCGVGIEFTPGEIEEEGTITVGSVIANGALCADETHFLCSVHQPTTLAEVDQHRIADALDSIDSRLAAEEGDDENG